MLERNIKILGVIPARFKSKRFEGKPLALINGVPMIKRTFIQASNSTKLNKLIVATDDQRIKDYCDSEKIPTIMTSENCLTGTDRIAEVSRTLNYDFYINIQGDEPAIDPESISQIIDSYNKYKGEYMVHSLYKIISDENEINSKTIVKVVVNEHDELMYSSRLPVPFSNTDLISNVKQQIPVYGFTKRALDIFSSQSKTLNEKFEDIELLRFLDLGHKIKMEQTNVDSISVDIPSDIQKVENFLNKHQKSIFIK